LTYFQVWRIVCVGYGIECVSRLRAVCGSARGPAGERLEQLNNEH